MVSLEPKAKQSDFCYLALNQAVISGPFLSSPLGGFAQKPPDFSSSGVFPFPHDVMSVIGQVELAGSANLR
jgi:hypothetical protein